MTSCSTAPASRPHGVGPVRHRVAGVDERGPAARRRRGRRGSRRSSRTSSRIASASGGRSTGALAATPRAGEVGDARPPRRSASTIDSSAVARRRYRWASCSQVKPMPPCTWMLSLASRSAAGMASVAATAAVYESWSPPIGGRPGRVPDRRGRQLGGDEHVGAVVLDRLEHRDRAAELLAHLGVLGGHLGALAGDAGGLGREGAARARSTRTCAAPGTISAAAPSSADAGGAAGGVDVGRGLDGHAVGREVDDRDVVAHGDERARRRGRRRGPTPAEPVRPAAVTARSPSSATRADGRAVGEAGKQTRPAVVVGGRCRDHRAGDDGGDERSRRDRPAQFLDDDHQLGEAEAGPAVRLGQVQAEPAQLAQLAPERRAAFPPVPPARRAARSEPAWRTRKSVAVSMSARWSSVIAIDMKRPWR